MSSIIYSSFLIFFFGFVALCDSACSPPWREYKNKCYFFSNNRYRFSDALVVCSTRNASLFVFQNDDEWNWMKSQIVHGQRLFYWVGLRIVNQTWAWIDDKPYDKNSTHWYRNKEGNVKDRGHLCVATPGYKPYEGLMYQRNCRESWLTICTRPNDMYELCDGDDGWHQVNTSCFKYFDLQTDWFNARSTCQDNGGDLYYPKNYEMLMSIGDLLVCRTVDEQAWIGVSDTVKPGTFLAVDNSTMRRYQPWQGSNRVILQKGNTCVLSNPMASFYWEVDVCDAQKKLVCEKPQGTCPDGWRRNKDYCFQVYDSTNIWTTWQGAYDFCRSQGTDLAIIESVDEERTIESLLKTRRVSNAWIGCSDINMTDVIQWVDGRNWTATYKHWARHYPKPHANMSDCCKISAGRRTYWSNTYCFNNMPFICKKKVVAKLMTPTQAPATSHCDPGWKMYKSNCYYFGAAYNMTGYSWDAARKYCFTQNADLTSIKDPGEQSFITLNMEAVGTAWIGLKYYNMHHQQQFLWSHDQSPAQFMNFYPGEPDDLDIGDVCIRIVAGRQDYTGSWDDGNCSTPQDFICKKPAAPGGPAAIPSPSTTPAGVWSYRCGPSWVYNSLEDFCYQIVTHEYKTWTDANWSCKQKGGYLLSISGPKEQTFIQAMLNTGVYATIQGNYWIGATDATREGGWEWIDNAPFSFIHWYPGEPNEYGKGEDCAEIALPRGYYWNDRNCAIEQQYICKKLPGPQMTSPGAPTVSSSGKCVTQPMISGDYSLLDSRSLTASSSRDSTHGPANSRLYAGSVGGWSSLKPTTNEYIQATFYNVIITKGIITAGRSDADEWVTQYKLRYQYDYFDEWLWYEEPPGTVKIFDGNTDSRTFVNRTIQFPIEAKSIRLYPVKYNRGMSLRWEILGCIEEYCSPDYAVSGPLIAMDIQIKTSASVDSNHAGPAARLHPIQQGVQMSCWRPQVMDSNQWIQVDLGNIMIARGITTMGNPNAQEWVTSYKVSYGMKIDSVSNYYQEPYGNVKLFQGNVDNNDTVTNYFKGHFQARVIRIWPVSFHTAIGLRFDVLVCSHGCKGLALISGPKKITDDMLNATSSLDGQHGPSRSRLNQPAQGPYGGAWVAKYNDHHQFIQADLGSSIQITGVATQGRQDGNGQEWVKTYYLSYSQDGNSWVSYSGIQRNAIILIGNWDQNTVRKHLFYIPFLARYVRIWPLTWNNRISLRWELYGCPGPDSGAAIGCFSDDTHDRDLPLEPFTDPNVGMWPPMCIHHCFRKGYYYAGLQAQYKCFCGNSYGRYGPSTNCNMNCFPRTRFKCGGMTSNLIFSTGLIPDNEVCPPHWKAYKDYCYLLLLDRKTWKEARYDCHVMGGDLATINSQPEQDLIYSIINGNGGQDVWIGLNDQVEENLFQWARGDPVLYTNWDVHQPEHPANVDEDCVMIAPGMGGWRDEKCESTHQYVCQAHKHSSDQPSTLSMVQGCEQGWDGYKWSCYLYVDMARSFTDAVNLCRSRAAELLKIDDRFEQSYLSSVLGSRNGQYWTDVTDKYSPGTYKFLDGSSLRISNWAPDRPACRGCCVSLSTGTSAGLWNDIPCNSTVGAICEKLRLGYTRPATPPTTTATVSCPQGWIDINDGFCYQVNDPVARNRKLDYTSARQDCLNQAADLASFHNKNDYGKLLQSLGGRNSMWIGLDERTVVNSKNVYRWTDNTPIDFTSWNPNEPNNYNGREHCVQLSGYGTIGGWNDIACTSKLGWMCKITKGGKYNPRTTMFYPTAPSPGMCGTLTGWSYYNGHCYLAVDGVGNQYKTWREARQWCANNGADLASITTILEQLFVNHLVQNVSSTDVWIGFSEIDFEYGYRWSDGSPASYLHWSPGQPDDYAGAEDCVEFRVASGTWNDAHCGDKKGYVCELVLNSTPPPTISPVINGYCPTGFSGYKNKCYKVVIAQKNWTDASKTCQAMGQGRKGWYLASILNQYESAFVTTLLSGLSVNPWIGLQTYHDGRLLWIDNQDLSYTNWERGEPNLPRYKMSICTRIYSYSHNAGKWDDIDCGTPNSYICETKKKTYITTPEPIPNPCNSQQGFQPFGADCFLFSNTAKTWSDADTYCKNLGSYLSTISSEFEQSFVFLMVNDKQTGQKKSAWIGLNDIAQSGTYKWTQPNWPVVYTKWASSEPSKQPGEGCVAMGTNGQWSDTMCNNTLPFVCKITTALPPGIPPPPNSQCPGKDWVANGTKCYNFKPLDMKNYLDAVLECQKSQATLVSIHSKAQNTFLLHTVNAMTVQAAGFWTSFHKPGDAGFAWVDGSPTQYTNWDTGEPSGKNQRGRVETCMEVRTWNGKWNDADCSLKKGYICQRDIAVDNSLNTVPPAQTPSSPVISPTPLPSPKSPPMKTTGNLITGTFIPPVGSTHARQTIPVIGTPPSYTGKTESQVSGSNGNSLSPGGIAGILIGVIIILCLVGISIILYRRQNKTSGAGLSFENTVYEYDSKNEDGKLSMSESNNTSDS